MSKLLLTCLLILTSWMVFSKSPTQPYQFNGPDFDQFLPFSLATLQTFQKKGVNKVERSWGNFRTTYFFNDQGQLVSDQEIWIKKKKKVETRSTTYQYDTGGRLTVKHVTGEDFVWYDSLAYDNRGRIIHYYHYQQYLTRKKKNWVKEVGYQLQLHSSNDQQVVLVDSTQNTTWQYTLDNDNQIRLIQRPFPTDSVSITWQDKEAYTKKYWYRLKGDTLFRLGQEVNYKKGLKQTETLWERVWDGKRIVYKTYYRYDEQHRLLRIENENPHQRKTFYTYNFTGLLMKEIAMLQNTVQVTQFNYWFAGSK